MRSEVRVPYRCDGAKGFRYGDLPPEVEAALPRWLAEGIVADGEEIKPGRVYRRGAWAVKLYPPERGLRSMLLASPAIRCADMTARLRPLRTPEPLVAVDGTERGVLVSEFVDGRYLHRLWKEDLEARAAFPHFMAEMHRHGVLHGDLNVRNVLWNGTEWVLIDLDSVRGGVPGLPNRRRIEEQWGRILGPLRGAAGSRECFEAYLDASERDWDRDESWERVSRLAREHAERWDAKRGGPPPALG